MEDSPLVGVGNPRIFPLRTTAIWEDKQNKGTSNEEET